jgi:soluble lytic murein transglycosylase-like protein
VAWTKAQLQQLVFAKATEIGFPVQIALNQINQESKWNIRAGSGAGAKGLCQFMPATARRFGITDVYDPVQSVNGWGKYMSFLMRKFKGNIAFALAGYNAGEGAVMKYGGVPPYKETQNYVRIIMQGQSTKVVTNSSSVSNLFATGSATNAVSNLLPESSIGKVLVGIGLVGLGVAVAAKMSK